MARFRRWLINYDAAQWNHQLEADVAAGRLDTLIRKAQRDHRAGRTKAL